MKKQLVLFALLLCSFSCASQKKEIVGKSTIKLERKNTNIRDLIEIDGYYDIKEVPKSNCRMFFEDGTWVQFYIERDVSEDEIKANISKYIHNWIKNKQVRWGSFWGVYRIQNDTIIAYRYTKRSFGQAWSLSEDRYKIVDKRTIQWISYRGLLKTIGEGSNKIHGMNKTFHFAPADSLPSSDCWLKEEKWIWRNEQDWKAYMEKVKQIKKQYKKK
jgi:hypothetical protein